MFYNIFLRIPPTHSARTFRPSHPIQNPENHPKPHFFCKRLAQFKKKQYLCRRFRHGICAKACVVNSDDEAETY